MLSKVREIVSKYGTRDPFELADCLGVVTITAPLKDDTRGFYSYFKRNGIICIESSLSQKESKFVCAHELGHFILHKTINSQVLKNTTLVNTNKYEIDANRFAVNLLISAEDIEEYKAYEYTVYQMARALGVSPEMMEMRLEK